MAAPVFRLNNHRLQQIAPLLIAAVAQIQLLIWGSPALVSPGLTSLSVRVNGLCQCAGLFSQVAIVLFAKVVQEAQSVAPPQYK